MTSKTRWSICLVTIILILGGGASTQAQDTVSITTPTGDPTWTTGNNNYSVAAVVYGSTPVSTMRVTIYNTDDPEYVYFINTSTYGFFWFINFPCPTAIKGEYTLAQSWSRLLEVTA